MLCRRVGVVGIVIEDRARAAGRVQEILSQYGDMIVGRMGIPYRERGLAVIALIVDGTTDQIGALTGKLGRLPGVLVRSALAPAGERIGDGGNADGSA
ncbi:MAG TPA: CopG family transcriptional regulator [Firmicutes bacterium]|nr:CopG family transcriptional regulator [Bacillota bacterium]